MSNEKFSPGSRIGQYRVIRKIGSGGTGNVYLCSHIVLGKSYAVKIIDIAPGFAGTELQGRLLREARIARRIRHRHLVPVVDANVLPQSGIAYIVMEYIDGETLEELIASSPLPESAALYVCRCVALVLAEAEKHAIVHRDIKPANILIDRAGNVKLTDLGIAKIDKSNTRFDEPVTREERLLGTPDYASPEQLRDSSSVDIRADIYSLGATLYHMLSGKKPFEAAGVFNLMAQVLESEPEEIQGISPATAALVKKMMAKNPADRPQNIRELLSALRGTMLSNASQTSEIKRFLANGARQIFSASNIRMFTAIRNIFIVLCAIISGVMIFLHVFYQYKSAKTPDVKNEKIIKSLQKSDKNRLSLLLEKGEISHRDIIKAVAESNNISVFKTAVRLFPDITKNKQYSPLWLDLLAEKSRRKMLALLLKNNFDVNAAKARNREPAVFRRELFSDEELLHMLIRNKLDVKAKDSSGCSVLIRMARSRRSQISCAAAMLSAGADINARDRQGRNAFNVAINSHNPEFARFLLKSGITLTDRDTDAIPDMFNLKQELLARRQTMLENTAEKSVVPETPKKIVAAVAEPKEPVLAAVKEIPPAAAENSDFIAAENSEKENVRRLAENRKLLRKKFDSAESAKVRRKIEVYLQTEPARRLALGGEKEFVTSFILRLKEGKTDPDIYTGKKHTHLLESAAKGEIYPRHKLFFALLQAGADPDAPAIPHNDTKLCRLLIDYGRSRFAPDDLIKLLSVASPDWKCAAAMVLRGAEPQIQSKDKKENAFHRAASLGNAAFLKLLLASGKPGADAQDIWGYTPYQRAVICGEVECAKLLEKSGYSVKTTSKMRNTGALFRAVRKNDSGETAYRLMLDADPMQVNGMYLNVLQYAAVKNSTDSVRALLENGVSPRKYTGVSPLLAALKNGNDEMFVLLINRGADPKTVVIDRFGRKSLLFTAVFRYMNHDPEKLNNCFRAMLEKNWNWKQKTPDGDTPVTWMQKWNEGYPSTLQLFAGKSDI